MKTLKDYLGWGIGLWLFGYVLGILFFFILPPAMIGWTIAPLGLLMLIWVLRSRIERKGLGYHIGLGLCWAALAVILDYFLLLRVFHPADGYYKPDVYLYYAFTLLLPMAWGWRSSRSVPTRV